MKAAVLLGQRHMVIEEVPKPVAGFGEVVLKVHYCGICGTDLEMFRLGSYHDRAILGHECSGVIEEVGPGVKDWTVGDRVVVDDVFPCGNCDFCKAGRERLCTNVATLGSQWPGAYAEYTKVPATALFRLPDVVSMEEGCLTQILAVGHHVVARASVRPNTKALIIGAGPVGLSALHALKMAGCEKAGIVAKHPLGKKAAMALGASAVFDPANDRLVDDVEAFLGSAPQLVIECVGKPEAVVQAMEMVEKEGTVVVVGNCFDEICLRPITWILKELNIKGSDGTDRQGFLAALGWLGAGKVDSSQFLTRCVELEELPETMHRLSVCKSEIKVALRL